MKKPYRYQIEWVSAEEDLEDAKIAYDSVLDWIERGGGYVEGGYVGLMKKKDVVPNSPLAKDLA